MNRRQLWLWAIVLMVIQLGVESKFHRYFTVKNDDTLLDMIDDYFTLLIADFLMALALNAFFALIPDNNETYRQKFRRLFPSVLVFAVIWSLVGNFAGILGLTE